MNDTKIHVYFMPGMAANPAIFKNIALPGDIFEAHLLEWFLPPKNTSLSEYAKIMCEQVLHQDSVLIGVSFGGMLVQEMAQQISVRKTIIISSVKKASELPRRMRFARCTGIHKLLPTGLVNNVDLLAKYALGGKINKRLALYEEYLSIRDRYYIDWSLNHIVNWRPSGKLDNLVHIHGEKDPVFPIRNIEDCIPVKNGTHTMIIHKAKWFNEHLPAIILQD